MIGIIGGSGLDNPKILKGAKEKEVNTPYGKPSSPLTIGKIGDKEVAIIARHGRKHTIPPTQVNFRANVWAMKEQGVSHILATTACGSLREKIRPGEIVFPDQFIDNTKHRIATFYDKDQVCHIPMSEPFCPVLRKRLVETAKKLGTLHHEKGTVITIEGPRFSTRAESNMFRSWGADMINMSTVPEAVLAREVGICYQVVAMATDYDCFLEDRLAVTINEILKVMAQNVQNVKKLFLEVIPKIPEKQNGCSCPEDIKTAILED